MSNDVDVTMYGDYLRTKARVCGALDAIAERVGVLLFAAVAVLGLVLTVIAATRLLR